MFFTNPSQGYSLENQYITIGLPTDNYPEIQIIPIKTVNVPQDKESELFYSPVINYGKWKRLEKFRNLNVAILKLAPTASNNAEISALELEVKIRFKKSLKNSIILSNAEELIYKHKIFNWSVAKNWVEKKSISKRIKSRNDLSGNWYKIAISDDGVYGISGLELSEIGADITNINPSSLRIFTNPRGGRPVSDDIFQSISDNLIEIAIKVTGENDGVLNENDKILFYGRGPRGFDTNKDGYTIFTKNPYTNLNVYWLNVPVDPEILGSRINTIDQSVIEPITINYGINYAHSENEDYNPFQSGLLWVGPGITKEQTLSAPIQLHHPRDYINAKANISLFGGTSSGSEGYPAHIATIQQKSQTDSILITESWAGMINRDFSLNLDETSDTITFNNSGCSSRLVARRNFPKRVSLASSGKRLPWVSVTSNMERNFRILKGLPCKPGRVWRNSTGLPKFIRIRIATSANTGANTSKEKLATITSNIRFSILKNSPFKPLVLANFINS